jgi:hypothetical protein
MTVQESLVSFQTTSCTKFHTIGIALAMNAEMTCVQMTRAQDRNRKMTRAQDQNRKMTRAQYQNRKMTRAQKSG